MKVRTKEITLLSKEEFEANISIIPKINDKKYDFGWWLLRTKAYDNQNVYAVNVDDNRLCPRIVSYPKSYIRPCVKIFQNETTIKPLKKIRIGGFIWTVLMDNIILCDKIVGETCFNKNDRAEHAANFDHSDVQKWLYEWSTIRKALPIWLEVD